MKYLTNTFRLEDLEVGESYMIDKHLRKNPFYQIHERMTKTSDDKTENIWLTETRPSPLPRDYDVIGHVNIFKTIDKPLCY